MHITVVEFIFRVFDAHVFVVQGARVFRIVLGFFKFMFRQDERPEKWFKGFDAISLEAHRVVEFRLFITIQ